MKNQYIDENDPFVISVRVRQEWGRAEGMLREVCRREEITRTQAIALYGDPRKWKPFGYLPLPPRPVPTSEGPKCEGCDNPATTCDSEAVPLCEKCAEECATQ